MVRLSKAQRRLFKTTRRGHEGEFVEKRITYLSLAHVRPLYVMACTTKVAIESSFNTAILNASAAASSSHGSIDCTSVSPNSHRTKHPPTLPTVHSLTLHHLPTTDRPLLTLHHLPTTRPPSHCILTTNPSLTVNPPPDQHTTSPLRCPAIVETLTHC